MDSQKKLQILQLVRDARMPVGAAFVCEKMGLPQATVGRMLLALEQEGFLQKVSNKGRSLTDSGAAYIAQQLQFYDKLKAAQSIIETVEAPSKAKLYEILEIRIALEAITAQRACENVRQEEMAELDAILLDNFYDLKRGGIGSEQDLRLHLRIAELSGNQTLFQLLQLILTQQNAYTKFNQVAPHITSTQIKQHTDIVEAIRAKDGTRARKAMVLHLQQVMEDVRLHYQG